MIDDEVKAVVLAIIVVVGVFAASQTIYAGRVVEPFSELGLLGPNKKIGDYPKEVVVGLPYRLYIYVGNHEGEVKYYRVLIKLGDAETFINETTPADAPIIHSFDQVLMHNQTVIRPYDMVINSTGTNLRLLVELWSFDPERDEFVYTGRWNQLWLNATAP